MNFPAIAHVALAGDGRCPGYRTGGSSPCAAGAKVELPARMWCESPAGALRPRFRPVIWPASGTLPCT